MKHRFYAFLFISLFLICTKISHSQNALGLKITGNNNYLGYSFADGYNDGFGYGAGLFGLVELSSQFYFNPGIFFARKSLDLNTPRYLSEEWAENDVRLGLNYISVPLNLGYGMFIDPDENNATRLFIMFYGGPQLNYLASQQNRLVTGRRQTRTLNQDITRINNPEWGANLGVLLGAGNFVFDLRYYLAFTRFLDYDAQGNNMNTLSLGIGYMLVFP